MTSTIGVQLYRSWAVVTRFLKKKFKNRDKYKILFKKKNLNCDKLPSRPFRKNLKNKLKKKKTIRPNNFF